MADIGLSLGTGLSSFARGLDMGDRINQRKSDQQQREGDLAFQSEQRDRQRQDWKIQDQDRAKAQYTQRLQGMVAASDAGVEIDENEFLDVAKGLDAIGVPFTRAILEPGKLAAFNKSVYDDVQAGQVRPQTLELFEWNSPELFKRGVGSTVDRDGLKDKTGRPIPKGSKIVRKEPSMVLPNKSGDGIFVGMDIHVQTPDGKTMVYEAPLTAGGTSNDDDPLHSISLDRLFQNVAGNEMLLKGIREIDEQRPDFAKKARAMLSALGGGPKPEGAPIESENEQGKRVFMQRYSDGTAREVEGFRPPPKDKPQPRSQSELEHYKELVAKYGEDEGAKRFAKFKAANESREDKIFKMANSLAAGAYDPEEAAQKATELVDRVYGTAAPSGGPVAVTTEAEVAKLAKGTKFTFNGKTYTKN